jgi:hypothetical protein
MVQRGSRRGGRGRRCMPVPTRMQDSRSALAGAPVFAMSTTRPVSTRRRSDRNVPAALRSAHSGTVVGGAEIRVLPREQTSGLCSAGVLGFGMSFALDQNGNDFLKLTEPGDLFAFTISREESNGSTSTNGSTVDPRLHRPPPWGLPDLPLGASTRSAHDSPIDLGWLLLPPIPALPTSRTEVLVRGRGAH